MAIQIAKPQGAVLPCAYPYRLTVKGRDGVPVPFPARCGWCYGCSQTKANDLIGRAGAQALVCTHVDFVTLTYDSKRGAEQRLSAKIRNVKHTQDFIKRLRQREARGLKAHNKAEQKAAALEDRQPQLVDATRSYIKHLTVFEYGTKNTKRSHWHMLIFYESHFPIPDALIATGDLKQTVPAARRVWDIPCKVGPIAEKRPRGAFDGSFIDFTVLPEANQEWDAWPHGQVNVQRVTHETNEPSGVPRLKTGNEMAKAVSYLNKYLRKNVKIPRGMTPARLSSMPLEKQAEFHASMRKNVHRTMSQGLGEHFAIQWGKGHARSGIPCEKMLYTLAGFNMKRKPESIHKHQASLMAQGGSALLAETLTDYRIHFEMRGAMRETAFDAYATERRRVTNKQELSEATLGAAFQQSLMKAESEEFNEFLRSKGAGMIRAAQSMISEGLQLLPDSLLPVHVYERSPSGRLCDGSRCHGVTEKPRYRSPLDRLKERRAEIRNIRARYEAAQAVPYKLQRFQQSVSLLDAGDLETETLFANRPTFQRARFKREVDAERVKAVHEQLSEAVALGNELAREELEYLDELMIVNERDAFGLDRFDLHHDFVDTPTLWRWVQKSENFQFKRLREQLIERHCKTRYLSADVRLVETPQNRLAIQRRTFSPNKATFECPETRKLIRHKGFKRWATRLCASPSEEKDALAGILPNRSPRDCDALFSGAQPLKPPTSWVHLD